MTTGTNDVKIIDAHKDTECEHDYEETPESASNFDYEQYECKKCHHRYKLWYDEMR
jgi:hypothetical protein